MVCETEYNLFAQNFIDRIALPQIHSFSLQNLQKRNFEAHTHKNGLHFYFPMFLDFLIIMRHSNNDLLSRHQFEQPTKIELHPPCFDILINKLLFPESKLLPSVYIVNISFPFDEIPSFIFLFDYFQIAFI